MQRPSHRKRSSWLLRLGALALCCVSFGCGRSDEPRVRRVVYWEKWTGFEGEAMDHVVEAFNERERARGARNAEYLPIQVERVTVSQIENKLLVAVAGKTPPDVAGLYGYLLATYADKGALTELTPRLAAANIRRADYLPRYFDLGTHRGRVWALPATPASLALHWNTRLFSEAGLDPARGPRTIEELDDYAERLTRWEVTQENGETKLLSGYLPEVPASRKRLVQVGFLPTDPIWFPYIWGYFFGGELTDGEGKASTDSPANLRGYSWFASYAHKLGVDTIQRFRSGFGKFSTPQNPFLSGKIAMQLQGVWMYNFIQQYAPGLQWNVGPFPYPADRPELSNHTLIESDILVIPKDAQRPDEAFEFIRFVNTPEVLERLCIEQRKFSPLLQVSDDFWREHPHPYVQLFRELGGSTSAFNVPPLGVWNEYLRELSNAADTIQHLNATPRDALGSVRQRMQLSIERDRRALEARGLL